MSLFWKQNYHEQMINSSNIFLLDQLCFLLCCLQAIAEISKLDKLFEKKMDTLLEKIKANEEIVYKEEKPRQPKKTKGILKKR